MANATLTFTPIEQAALKTILEERPEVPAAIAERLTPASDDLITSCQGLIITEAEAEDLLARLRYEFVVRTMDEMEPWGDDEDLRERQTRPTRGRPPWEK